MDLENKTKSYKSKGAVKFSCQYHVIFCPKFRRHVLVNGIDEELKRLLFDHQDSLGYEVLDVEVMPDHVHALLDIDPKKVVVNVVGRIKGMLAHELREKFPSLKSRLPSLWTRSCFISSVGAVSLEVVKKYIENQKNV